MLSKVFSATVFGIDGHLIVVEVDIAAGLPALSIVGLPDTSVKESRDRVIAAIRNSGFDFPTRKITVNLAPADIKKEGDSHLFTFKVSKRLGRYIVEKGSIAVNGISLTVIDANDKTFTVGIIPYTWKHTMLSGAKVGDKVNVEVDILAKYLEKLEKAYHA